MDAQRLPPTTMSTRSEHFEDETDASSLSDYDSEWTQISGAEDGDSDAAPLTAGSDRPLSRADTLDGSVDGDVWEGVLDDVASDYGDKREFTRLDELDATQLHRDSTAQSLSASAIATEDDRVNSALDCSLMGTLRASRIRSATSSLQGSMTDSQSKLRLSFPDPLLRPGDDASDSDPAPVTDDSMQDITNHEHHEDLVESETSSSPVVVETPSTLGDSEQHHEEIESAPQLPTSPATLPAMPENAICIINLVLYGSASSSKWTIAEKIMKLILQIDCLPATFEHDESVRRYTVRSNPQDLVSHVSEPTFYTQIVDRTAIAHPMEHTIFNGPTLAIVLLPSSLPAVLPEHDLYLPLISTPALDFGSSIPALSSAFSEQVMKDSAHYAWSRVNVPSECRVVLDTNHPEAILDVVELERLDQTFRHKALRKVLLRTKLLINGRQHKAETVRMFPNGWYILAFVATTLLAVTAGNRMRAQDKGAPGVALRNINSSMPAIVSSSDVSSRSAVNAVSLFGSTKDYALSSLQTRAVALTPSKVLSQTSLALSTDSLPGSTASSSQRVSQKVGSTHQPPQAGPSDSSTSSSGACNCHKKSSWADKFNVALDTYLPKDVMPLPDTRQVFKKASSPLSTLLKKQMVVSGVETTENTKTSGKKPVKEVDVTALSMDVMDNALSTIQSVGKALIEVIGQDYKVLCDAIDELLRALDQYLETAKSSLGIATANTKSELKYRNERAKANAKKIRRAGERFIKAAGVTLRSGTEEALKAFERVRGNVKKMRNEAEKSRRVRRARRKERREVKETNEKPEVELLRRVEEQSPLNKVKDDEEKIGFDTSRSGDTKKFREEWVGRGGDRKRMQTHNRKEARALKRELRRAKKCGDRIDIQT